MKSQIKVHRYKRHERRHKHLKTGENRRKRIIIGGDPHSGKSTFMVLLKRDLRDKGVNVEVFDLDYASPTTEWIQGAETRGAKQEWTMALAERAKNDFEKVSQRHDITLGDSVGRITDITRHLTKSVHGAIVLSNTQAGIEKWVRFYRNMGIPIIAVVESRFVEGKRRDFFIHKIDEGEISNLSRTALRSGKINDDNIVIESITHEIGERFGIPLKQERNS